MQATVHVSLPKPLSGKENIALLQLLANGDETAKDRLVEGNARLAIHIAKKFANTGLEPEDLFGIAVIGLVKAVNTFKLEKEVKFATYASRCMENEILMFLRRNLKHHQNVKDSLDAPIGVDEKGKEMMLSDIIRDTRIGDFSNMFQKQDMQQALATLKPSQQQVIHLRYIQEMTQREAAVHLGVSQSYLSRIEGKAIRTMRAFIHNEPLHAHKKTSVKKVSKVSSITQKKVGEDMGKNKGKHKGDRPRAIELLKNTMKPYKEIAAETGVPPGTLAHLGIKHRSEEVRREIASAPKTFAKAQAPQEEVHESFASEISFEEELKQEIPLLREQQAARQQEEKKEEMVVSSPAKQTSRIVRQMALRYASNGESIPYSEFIEEMDAIIQMIQNNGAENVTFSINVETK